MILLSLSSTVLQRLKSFTEAYLGLYQMSMVELFCENSSIIDVWLYAKCPSDFTGFQYYVDQVDERVWWHDNWYILITLNKIK